MRATDQPTWTPGAARRFSERVARARGLRRVVELAAETCPEAFDRDPATGELAVIDEMACRTGGRRRQPERTNARHRGPGSPEFPGR